MHFCTVQAITVVAKQLRYRYPDEPLEQLTDLAFGDGPAVVNAPGARRPPASRAKRSRRRAGRGTAGAEKKRAVDEKRWEKNPKSWKMRFIMIDHDWSWLIMIHQ